MLLFPGVVFLQYVQTVPVPSRPQLVQLLFDLVLSVSRASCCPFERQNPEATLLLSLVSWGDDDS